jgi:hypothetical protein
MPLKVECVVDSGAKRGELVEYLKPYRPCDIDGHPWKDWALDDAGGQRRWPCRRGERGRDRARFPRNFSPASGAK